jgi:hypothetical protein
MKSDKMDIMFLSLNADMTDNEIKDCIQNMIPVCMANRRGFCLTLGGFDNDSRELWQIPEAIQFMKKLCNIGFISVLEVSTTSPDLIREEFRIFADGKNGIGGFGALEVWMCATEIMGLGQTELDQATLEAFRRDLDIANEKSAKICKEPPYNTNLKLNKKVLPNQIPDAPVKYYGYKPSRN